MRITERTLRIVPTSRRYSSWSFARSSSAPRSRSRRYTPACVGFCACACVRACGGGRACLRLGRAAPWRSKRGRRPSGPFGWFVCCLVYRVFVCLSVRLCICFRFCLRLLAQALIVLSFFKPVVDLRRRAVGREVDGAPFNMQARLVTASDGRLTVGSRLVSRRASGRSSVSSRWSWRRCLPASSRPVYERLQAWLCVRV